MFVKSTILAISTSTLLARGAPVGSTIPNGSGGWGGQWSGSGGGLSVYQPPLSPQFTVSSFAATCWASNSPTCQVFVPTSQGFSMYQSGSSSNSISGYALSGNSFGSAADGVSAYTPMAAVTTNDVGGTEVSVFFMSNSGSTPTLSYYTQNADVSWSSVQQVPTSSGGSLSNGQQTSTSSGGSWHHHHHGSAPTQYMTTASWSCDGNPCYGVWWSDNSGAVYQLLNINGDFTNTGALSGVVVSGDYHFAVSVSENSQSATVIEIYGNGGELWQTSPSSTSALVSASFTQTTFASVSLSGMTGVNIWTGDGRLYNTDSTTGALVENSYNGGTTWVPAATEAGGTNPWNLIPAVGGAVTSVAQAYWSGSSEFIQVFSIVTDNNGQHEIDSVSWQKNIGWGKKTAVALGITGSN